MDPIGPLSEDHRVGRSHRQPVEPPRGRSFSFGMQRRPVCRPGDAAGPEDHGEIRSRKHAAFIMRRAAYIQHRTIPVDPLRPPHADSTATRQHGMQHTATTDSRSPPAQTCEPHGARQDQPRHGRPWVVSAMSYVGYDPSNCIRALGGGVGTPARSGLRHRNPETRRRMGRKRARKRTLQSRA